MTPSHMYIDVIVPLQSHVFIVDINFQLYVFKIYKLEEHIYLNKRREKDYQFTQILMFIQTDPSQYHSQYYNSKLLCEFDICN